MSEPVEDWASVSDAAAVFGVSERAIQKRCQKGKLAARQTLTSQGMRWEIDPAALNESGTRTGEPLGREPGRERTGDLANGTRPHISEDAQNHTNRDANARPIGREQDAPERANREDELRDEVKFLRGVVEQQQRDAAELRAALREALKLSAKALPEGHSDGAVSATNAAANTLSTETDGSSAKGAHRPAQREARPLWKVILGIR